MKSRLAILAGILLMGGFLAAAPDFAAHAQAPDPQATPVDSTEPVPLQQDIETNAATAELAGLLENALQNRVDSLAPLIFDVTIDHVVFSSDGQAAAVWVAMVDPQTGEVLATEPSLVIANRSAPDASWSLTLPPDEGFASALAALPEELISSELRETFLAEALNLDEPTGQVFRGYLLPWAGGLSKHLSGSIGHYLVYNPPSCVEYYCRYAFDFTDGSMFPLLAAKGGEVYRFYDGCANGSTDCTNYIVLKDNSTEPVTYQTYLHLAYNTIPAGLKAQGAQVLQGQYIGNVDDTGFSTGHHVHFHVFSTPTSIYWGPSVDITFDDVSINGGRPRTCYEAANWPSLGSQCQDGDTFTSGNFGANPPTATLTLPAQGEVISDGSLLVAGTASDDLGVTKVQAMAKIDGEWVPIGSSQVLSGAKSVSYILDIDLCDAGVLSGPLDVAVRVWDYEGNYSLTAQSPRAVIDNTVCLPEPPACQPASNQVALYTGPNYTGACRVLGLGTYASASSFSPVADDSLSSLLVGSNVEAILYDAVSSGGRSETIVQDDANLADNRIGTNRMSSVRVAERTLAISAPTLSTPYVTSTSVTSADSLVLDWAAPGAVSFEASLSGPLSLTQAYGDSNAWSVGSLPAGDYTWTVKAKTVSGAVVSKASTFSVAAASQSIDGGLSVPADQLEEATGWSMTSAGLWHWEPNYDLDGRTADAWVYNNGTDIGSSVGASDLTSPPFTVPSGPVWLAFDYNTQTETDTPYWDQRWVQISVNGGRFENLLQLSGERMAAWLSSPWIDLSAYAGQSVRVRFHFDIVDKFYNGTLPEGGVARGWAIDNVRVFSASLPACAESSNDTPGTATTISIDSPLAASICSPGDVDYYRFSAAAGQRIGAELAADGAALELALFAPDGRSLLDSSPNSVGLVAVEAGDYILRVRAADHPGVGSASDTYTLNLIQDSIPPSVTLLSPASSWLPASHATLVAQASDSDSGVARVEFLWHSPDWQNGDWVVLDSDSEGSDGWSGSFDPSALSNFEGSALAAQAFDFAGNSWTVARFGLKIDITAPVSQMQTLPAVTNSTAVNLQWSATDASGEMARFELQVDEGNDGSWQMLDAAVPGTSRNYWFIGQPGATYAFRIRAIDAAGNAESFPAAAEAVTTLAADCSGDEYEEDDDAGGAKSLTLEAAPQIHSLCGSGDLDWVKFSLPVAKDLSVMLNSRSGGAAVRVSLYAVGDTANALATAQSGEVGQGVILSWPALPAGEYLLKIEPLRADVYGTDAKYALWVGEPKMIYLPVIEKQ